jgi:hypothetical protein
MSLYEVSIPQIRKMLGNLDRWLEAAVTHAKSKSFDANVLCMARLAPDQFALLRQVQVCCDLAKYTASRLTGQEAPKHPDTEQTIEELRARIAAVMSYLDTFTPADFAGAGERRIELPVQALEGKVFLGRDYLSEWALPNFYFHVAHAYAILRHNGVPLGKRDFLGALTLHDK